MAPGEAGHAARRPQSIPPAFAIAAFLRPPPGAPRVSTCSRQPRTLRLPSVRACASAPETAREAAVTRGEAFALPPEARALVAAQLERPIYAAGSDALPAAARAAQRAQPPRFLTDDECGALRGGAAAARLRDRCDDVIRAARARVREESPGIEEEGGALWPAFRAEACWRDLQNFLRVISYGCCAVSTGGERVPYLDPQGCAIMDRIYTALEVPRKEMVLGIVAARDFAVQDVVADLGEEELAGCLAAFNEMATMLREMPGKR